MNIPEATITIPYDVFNAIVKRKEDLESLELQTIQWNDLKARNSALEDMLYKFENGLVPSKQGYINDNGVRVEYLFDSRDNVLLNVDERNKELLHEMKKMEENHIQERIGYQNTIRILEEELQSVNKTLKAIKVKLK